MINLKFEDKNYPIKNELDELTIKEFEEVSNILNNDKLNNFEKWIEVFQYFGVPDNVIDQFDTEDFIKLIKSFNLTQTIDTTIIKEITIDNLNYLAYDESFKLTVKDSMLIEQAILKNPNRYLGEILAIIYKRPDVDKEITYDKAHIHFKAELFRKNVTANYVIPILTIISKKIILQYESTTELE